MVSAAAAQGATLGEILRLPAFAGAEVFPPETDLDLVIAAFAPADDEHRVDPGTLLVVAGAPAGIPQGAVATVARHRPAERSLPAIVIAPTVPWTRVLDELAAAIASGGATARTASARARLRLPLVNGAGFNGVANAAAEILRAPVAILDEYLDQVADAHCTEDERADLATAVERARGHGPTPPLGPFLGDAEFAATRVRVQGPRGAVGVVVCFRPDRTAATAAVLTEIADAVLIERARDDVRNETEASLRGELIDELLAAGDVGRESVVRRGRLLGTDLAEGAVAIAARLTDPHNPHRQIHDERILRRLLQQLRGLVERDWPRSLLEWHEDRLMGFLPTATAPGLVADQTRDQQATAFVARLHTLARPAVPGFGLTLAVSRHTLEPERLGAALEEADLALSIAGRLDQLDGVTTFEETGTYKLLFQILADRPDELQSFYQSTLGPLTRYDEQYNTDLVATIATYLELDGNLAATAAKLFTHRHTIRYRLDRAADISGLDIGKSDDREKLTLALKSMRLLGRPIPVAAQPVADRDSA